MRARLLLGCGGAVLLLAWLGPLPALVPGSFTAHMLLHMLVVGVGVPLCAAGLAGMLRHRPRPLPLILPTAASLIDMMVVWVWHAPVLHHASRMDPLVLMAEQASFAAAALLLWLVALAGPPVAGMLELFFTAMHMVLLGVLLGLAPQVIYQSHGDSGWLGLGPLQDQQTGGIVMLAIGGVIYLAGGLALAARLLRREGGA